MKASALCLVATALVTAPASADVLWLPCDLPIAAMAPVHVAHRVSHPRHRHVHHRRHVGGGRRALGRLVARHGGMCPVWAEELGGPPGFTPWGQDIIPIDVSDSDLGGDWLAGGGYDSGGWGGDVPSPEFIAFLAPDTPPSVTSPDVPLSPPLECCGPSPLSAPVPEPSTWVLMVLGFVALVAFSRYQLKG